MILVFNRKANSGQIEQISKDLDGYVKFVVDLEKNIVAAGGKKHVDAEQMLLQQGSKQTNLWGGGFDLETAEIDFDSMINIRPSQNNPSREVLDKNIRSQIVKIVRNLVK